MAGEVRGWQGMLEDGRGGKLFVLQNLQNLWCFAFFCTYFPKDIVLQKYKPWMREDENYKIKIFRFQEFFIILKYLVLLYRAPQQEWRASSH